MLDVTGGYECDVLATRLVDLLLLPRAVQYSLRRKEGILRCSGPSVGHVHVGAKVLLSWRGISPYSTCLVVSSLDPPTVV